MRSLLIALGSFSLAALLESPAAATTVRKVTLESAVRSAGNVVYARVLDVRAGRDEHGVPSTWTTFRTNRTIKGASRERFTIKQFGVNSPLADGTVKRVPGMPVYQVGEDVVLLLHPESTKGFTSPVGMGQGVFRVSDSAGGKRALGTVGQQAPASLDELLETLTRLTAENR